MLAFIEPLRTLADMDTTAWLAIALAFIVGLVLGPLALRLVTGQSIKKARAQAEELVRVAQEQSKTTAQKAEVDAQKAVIAAREKAEKEAQSAREEIRETERRLAKKEDAIDRKEQQLTSKEEQLEKGLEGVKQRESLERYIQRLEQLQDIALSFGGVNEAYAIQAGREVRVMVDAKRVGDDEAYFIAKKIAERVSAEMTFPGEIRVTVLRETRAVEVAR